MVSAEVCTLAPADSWTSLISIRKSNPRPHVFRTERQGGQEEWLRKALRELMACEQRGRQELGGGQHGDSRHHVRQRDPQGDMLL